MASKAYVVTDLGSGDGGKGSVVHSIATAMRAHTVIKRGGAQGSHGVRTSGGWKFDFSQWGCGTLEGIKTFLSEQMVIAPDALLNEAAALRYQVGIYEPFSLLTVDENALCATPYHGIASRLNELARRDNPRGTVGTGVGEAYRFRYSRIPRHAILAGDLRAPDLRDRLAIVREHVRSRLAPVIDGGFLATDQTEADEEIRLLYDDGFLNYVVGRFSEVADLLAIVGPDYLCDLLARDGAVVVESSHGVLTDNTAGFQPHTSALPTLPRYAHRMLEEHGCEEIVHVGVTRGYAVRHGAGPLPTADPMMADRLLPARHADDNRYQGEVRVGPLDLILLRYAIRACGGPSAFNGLAVTCMDQVRADRAWRMCNRYAGADDPALFSPDGEIRLADGPGGVRYEHQAALADALLGVTPEITALLVDETDSNESLYDLCAAALEPLLGIPVRMVSVGPTEHDKLYR